MEKELSVENPVKKIKDIEIKPSGNTISFSDRFHIATRSDGLLYIQFLCETPASLNENFSTMIPKESVQTLIDVLAKATDHYPVKPVEKEPKPSIESDKTEKKVKNK
jgi:hypothetical protein